ncbi:MAG: hypothetical protein M0T83_08810 [Nitrospiraceae bacterium]|jgi:hypothetical protein|nr:hypothetical protein [Nitrospiraceae bacterium]
MKRDKGQRGEREVAQILSRALNSLGAKNQETSIPTQTTTPQIVGNEN